MTKITRFRGDTKRMRYTVKDKAGSPVDITGWSFKLTVSSDPNPENTDNQQAEIFGVIDTAAEGELHFPFVGVTIDVGTHYYDIEAVDQNGESETLVKSEIKIEQDIGK